MNPQPPLKAVKRPRIAAAVAFYALLWIVLAIAPNDRGAWLLENLLVAATALFFFLLRRKLRLSEASYLLIATFMTLHAIGAHYTYAETPIGFWLQAALDMERNHYDRIVHFSFGFFLAYPLLESSERYVKLRGILAYVAVFMTVMTASTLYELMEWVVAIMAEPNSAIAWLGTQGDPFDSQKDTALAGIGSLIMLGMAAALRRHWPRTP